MKLRRFVLSWLALLPLTLFASPAVAVHVRALNYGHELAGGLITVHYSAIFPGGVALETGSVTYSLLGDPSAELGYSPPDPNFVFVVSGETSAAPWTLLNTTAPAPDPFAVYISKVTIDLRSSLGGVFPSLFDNDSEPSTPFSGRGVFLIDPIGGTGPAPFTGIESDSTWPPSLDNLGDMYGITTLTWSDAAMLGPGQSFYWIDDTDLVVIPEPTGFSLLFLVAAALISHAARRRSRR